MIPRLARRRRSGSAPPGPPGAGAPGPPEPQGLPPRALVPRPEVGCGPVTETLFAHLTSEDLAQVQDRLQGEHRVLWDTASPEDRKRLALGFALLYGVSGVPERTGLIAASPPHDVHSMAHEWLTEIGGSYYLADIVLGSLGAVGAQLPAGAVALDFSCSSGRVVRPLQAARPDVHWHGCDPNVGAIAWVRDHFPQLEVFVSETAPPLPFAAESLHLVFAISVWSHYSATAALRWLEEMHRAIRPGGHLIMTTHGLHSCGWFTQYRDPAIEAKLGGSWITDTVARLQHQGHCFWDVFGKRGDWGVVDSDWGLAFFTPEWLLEHVTPAWTVGEYRIGRALGNQDLYVLERR